MSQTANTCTEQTLSESLIFKDCHDYLTNRLLAEDDNWEDADWGDAFYYTGINNGVFTPIENLTPDEIIKLAMYVRACELIDEKFDELSKIQNQANNFEWDDENDCLFEMKPRYTELLSYLENYPTYGELYEAQIEIGYETKCFGEIRDCNGYDSELGLCCHKRYAWTVAELRHFTFDKLTFNDFIYFHHL